MSFTTREYKGHLIVWHNSAGTKHYGEIIVFEKIGTQQRTVVNKDVDFYGVDPLDLGETIVDDIINKRSEGEDITNVVTRWARGKSVGE